MTLVRMSYDKTRLKKKKNVLRPLKIRDGSTIDSKLVDTD